MPRRSDLAAKQAAAVRLRRAESADADMILRWRNDPWIVSLGKGGRRVSAPEHAAWMERVLASPERHLLFVIQVANAKDAESWLDAGLIRLDRVEGERARVTIYLMRPYTGKGHGGEALRKAIDKGFGAWPDLRALQAEVRRDNQASLKMFERCGFAASPNDSAGPGLVQLQLQRDAWT